MENYRYRSVNTFEQLSLHDCQGSVMRREDRTLVLEMEWMEVLAAHPDNPYDKAHQSGEGKIVLRGAVIESCELIKAIPRNPCASDCAQAQ